MYKKKLQVETAGFGGALGPAGGALEEGATRKDPVMGAAGGAGGALVGSALGGAAGAATGAIPFVGPMVAPIAAPAGAAVGGMIGSGVGGEMLGGQKKKELLQAATSDDMPSEDPVERFLNKHSSTAEATQEFDNKKVLPPTVDGNTEGKLVTSTACNSGKMVKQGY